MPGSAGATVSLGAAFRLELMAKGQPRRALLKYSLCRTAKGLRQWRLRTNRTRLTENVADDLKPQGMSSNIKLVTCIGSWATAWKSAVALTAERSTYFSRSGSATWSFTGPWNARGARSP